MLDGKIIIITCGSSGVSKKLAQRLGSRGSRLALVARDEKNCGRSKQNFKNPASPIIE